ncbi:hypothetical protein SNE40_010006 [Patella caerulea]|uniref:protein-tyrosine-phosphatase n=1 Tax=Patella caerulea TaxID=87958 RepID=A0AAN8PR34_PATCE
MPFKWRLKKTKRYEISTKNAFIVGVYLLDNSFLECTLTSDSTGHECLDSIAQRIEITETHFFGLRYVTKKLHFHWVDLERPLKKQLDKQAQISCHPPCLYFGVQFYVASAHRIPDEVARFHYYLQLKNDIIDGRLPCSVEQAVRLAALSLQAEFGDCEYDKQNPAYFKDHPLLPKSMTKDESTFMELLSDVINGHYRLHGVHGIKAEIQYIKEVQQMDGFGTEYYIAKDDSGKELYLGTSYIGLFARFLDRQPPVFFRWAEIARVSQNKKNLEVDTSKSSAQYTLEDTDTSKYLCRIINYQIKFYKSSKANLNVSMTDVRGDIETDNNNTTEAQVALPQTEYSELTESQTSLAYIQDQRYTPDVQQMTVNEDFYTNSQQSLDVLPDFQHIPNSGSESHINEGIYMNHQPGNITQQQDIATRAALLPAYRHTPDYETLMAQRMATNPQQQHTQVSTTESAQSLGSAQIYNNQDAVTFNSEPEIRQPISDYKDETQYANAMAIRNYSHSVYASGFQDGHDNINNRTGERSNHLPVHSTYSSPELNTQGLQEQFTSDMIQDPLPYQYRPPPPYPRTSSSTPDLAVQAITSHNNEIPDIVAQQGEQFGNLAQQSRFDKSIENLNEMESNVKSPSSEIVDQDDTSSEHSYATFHVKDDSSDDDTEKLRREESERKKIQVRLVGPKEAPPPSKSKEVATLRESFRRMMIARAGPIMSSKPGDSHVKSVTKDSSDITLSKVEESVPTTKSNPVILVDPPSTSLPIPDVIQPSDHVTSSRHMSDTGSIKCLESNQVVHTQALSMDSSTSQQEDSDSDLSDFADGTIRRRSIGPLKRAAMNGLTLSRPMVLALMNDESRAPKDERRKILESKISEGQVFVEFEEIYKRAPNLEYNVAKLPENNPRNRFKDVLPYDNTRVKLTPRKDNPAGYINASHVKLTAENMDWWFIATQAPLENTVSDFWQMIWEQEVDVVAMLTALTEQGRQKCFPYRPDEPGPSHRKIYGDFEIELLLTDDSLCYVTRRITVRHLPSGKSRQIWHLQYTDWPDHGCPDDIYGFLGFLDEIESVRRLAESEEGSGKKAPVVVHCSAGVGRTGVVILTAVMKWCLEHNHSVDLPKALTGIRQQRMYMVQTLGQYQFIHNTLIQYLKNTRLI